MDASQTFGLGINLRLLIGFAGGLRRSEIAALEAGRAQSEDGRGWIEIVDQGIVVTLRGNTDWREVEIGGGSSDLTCPVSGIETWLTLRRIAHGPLLRRVTGKGKELGPERLKDQEVARLVMKAVLASGIRGELPEAGRVRLFSGHSLRAGLTTSAEVDERQVQKLLGHASAQMTRRYQRRRDRFQVNLTKAAGL